jgi:hypothetical protein
MREFMDVELWRERRRDLLREAQSARMGGRSELGDGVRGWVRRALAVLGYSDPGLFRGSRKVVERPREARCRRGARNSRRYCVDSKAALTRFEAALTNQVALAGGDPAVESAARALRDALRPAARQLALELIEQAAAEVDAQLPYQRVEVVLRGGEPTLEVRAGGEGERRVAGEEYEARITLRLPPSIKSAIEEAARSAGESVNSYLVRDLSRLTARPGRVGQSLKGTVRT